MTAVMYKPTWAFWDAPDHNSGAASGGGCGIDQCLSDGLQFHALLLGQPEESGEGLVSGVVMLGHQNALRLTDHGPRLQRVLELCGSSDGVVVAAHRGEGDACEAREGSRDAAAVVAERLPGRGVEVERTDGAAGGRKTDGERVAHS